jgi:pimeloyl-ACP methyl ester carboxylesterase
MLSALFMCFLSISLALPSPPFYFTQRVDHYSINNATFQQRWYQNDTSFSGPGALIICIMGGEEAIDPSKGILYPSIVVLAARVGALIIEPEHRFFGASLPVPPPYSTEHLALLTPYQSLADAAALITATREARNCTGRGGQPRCPVLTVGGSYPGWQAAMMRLRYPAVVDFGYSASPAMRFYAQNVSQYDYYRVVTESAAFASPTCPAAVRSMLARTLALADKATMQSKLNLCAPLPAYLLAGDAALLKDELHMVFSYSWANLNMGAYPPPVTRLATACEGIEANATIDPWGALSTFYDSFSGGGAGPGGCFNLSAQMPSGVNATISGGDWSGVGFGDDGASWDFQTCTLLVEPIGTNGVTDMFLPRSWSYEWLNQHCLDRFGVTPQPRALAVEWGFDLSVLPSVTSHIVFTNGLRDGWSVGGVPANLSDTLLVYDMPNGAHHSDLNYKWPNVTSDTQDVLLVRELVASKIEEWVRDFRNKSENA